MSKGRRLDVVESRWPQWEPCNLGEHALWHGASVCDHCSWTVYTRKGQQLEARPPRLGYEGEGRLVGF